MRRWLIGRWLIGIGLALALLWAARVIAQSDRRPFTSQGSSTVVRVSVSSDNAEANGNSYKPAVAGDDRFIAFESDASNLVPNDTNNARDIFVHDRATALTERVSVHSNGGQANSFSYSPSISADGRYVTFHSYATNLVDGDANNVPDIFLYDRQTNSTTLVSRGLSGAPANDVSYDPVISADGHYIAFWSYADNLVPNDFNDRADVFRYHRDSGQIERASVTSSGVEGTGDSRRPAISADGSRIAFESTAGNLVPDDTQGYQDIFLRSFNTGEINRVSISSSGAEAQGDSSEASLSDDGQLVAFTSLAANLVDGDTNFYGDVFVRNRANNTTERISVTTGGGQANEGSSAPMISGDNGRYVVFKSRASNLVSGDTNNIGDIFIRDRESGTTTRLSVSETGSEANNASNDPAISGDGRFVAFESPATNLVTNDHNGARDIFLYDRNPPPPATPTATATATATATPTSTPTPIPQLSPNHTTGAPGSYFTMTGSDFPPNSSADVMVNRVELGPVTVDGSGNLQFLVCSTAASDPGYYFVEAAVGSVVGGGSIWLDLSQPIWPQSGSGPLYCLPEGVALTRFSYLPIARR